MFLLLAEKLPEKNAKSPLGSSFPHSSPTVNRRGRGLWVGPAFFSNPSRDWPEARRRREAGPRGSASAGAAAILSRAGFREGPSASPFPAVRRVAVPGPRPSVRLEPGSVPAGSGGGGRMSAEAADREAATSSRPCTPPQTCWFEFLLEESLLEKHLRKPCPGKRGACSPTGAGPGPRANRRASRPPALSGPRSRGQPGPLAEQEASGCGAPPAAAEGERGAGSWTPRCWSSHRVGC